MLYQNISDPEYDSLDQAYRYVFYGTKLVERHYNKLLNMCNRVDSNVKPNFNEFVSYLESGSIVFDINTIANKAFELGHVDAFRCAAPLSKHLFLRDIEDAKPQLIFMFPELIKNMNVKIIARYIIKGYGDLHFDPRKLYYGIDDEIAFGYLRLFDDEEIKSKLDCGDLSVIECIIKYKPAIMLGYPIKKIIDNVSYLNIRKVVVVLLKVYSIEEIMQIQYIPLDYTYYVKKFEASYEEIKKMFGGILVELDKDYPLAIKILELIKRFMSSYDVNILAEAHELVDYSSSVPLIKILEHKDLLEGVVHADNLNLYTWLAEIFDIGSVILIAWRYSSMNIFMFILEQNWKPEYDSISSYDDFCDGDDFLEYLSEIASEEKVYSGSTILEVITKYPPMFCVINPTLLIKYFSASDYKRLGLKTQIGNSDQESFKDDKDWVTYLKIFNIEDVIEQYHSCSIDSMVSFIKYYPEIVEHLDIDTVLESFGCDIEYRKKGDCVNDELKETYEIFKSRFGIDRLATIYRNEFNKELPEI
jgi:hypothetical protein